MKIAADGRLFWFLRQGTLLDLEDPSILPMVLQQVLSHGRIDDIRSLLGAVDRAQFEQGLKKIGRFLPREVQTFWEDFFAGH